MDIRYAIHPEQMKLLGSEDLRRHFLMEKFFQRGKTSMVYSHIDRIIAGGVCPTETELKLAVTKELGVDTFLERREMGIINIGPAGTVRVDGKDYPLENKECLYIGMGQRKSRSKARTGIIRPNSILTARRLMPPIRSSSFP